MTARYSFAFSVLGFDAHGEEHRLEAHSTEIRPGDGLPHALKSLVAFAARLLRVPVDDFAVRRLLIKSAWCYNFKGRGRVTKQALADALAKGWPPKGRGEAHVEKMPSKPFDVKAAARKVIEERRKQRRAKPGK